MADFRRLFTALALVALFVGLASAQGGLSGGSTMACSTTTTVTPTVRAEGFTELVGDIVLNCTGGTTLAYGTQIPQANITVFLNTQVTSRILSTSGVSNNASEALLLIDEPGSSTVSGYGANLADIPCTTPNGTGCVEYVSNSGGNIGVPSQTQPPTAFSAGWNVFHGVVSGNSVTFYGVPILPPSTTGSRIYRITNVRANANGISGGGPTPGSVTGSVSISPSNAFTINQPLNTLAFVSTGLATALRKPDNSGGLSAPNLAQCSTNNGNGGNSGNGFGIGLLQFTENFPTAFKTRLAVINGSSATTPPATPVENVPGQVYNSESGFLLNDSLGSSGLADWGTRLKAVFSNIPSGVSIFVSTTNVANATTLATTSAGNPIANLLISETVPDTNNPATASTTSTQGAAPYGAVTIVNGTGIAVWEVVQNGYTTNQSINFGVYLQYSGGVGSSGPVPGAISVNLSLAPNPTNGAFAASAGAVPTTSGFVGTGGIPRFADTSTAKTLGTFAICQSVLLFPFVTTASGFETGLGISNTTQDPFGTTPQSGSCTLNWYTAGASGTNPAATTTPAIPGGTTYTTLSSATTNAGPGFTGYMFAVCNFQLAHGYAAITDVGSRSIFASYLPLVVTTGTGSRSNPESFAH